MRRNIVRLLLICTILVCASSLVACKPKPNNGVTDITVEYIGQ